MAPRAPIISRRRQAGKASDKGYLGLEGLGLRGAMRADPARLEEAVGRKTPPACALPAGKTTRHTVGCARRLSHPALGLAREDPVSRGSPGSKIHAQLLHRLTNVDWAV